MSINATPTSSHCKKTLKSSLSQPDNYQYSRHSVKDCHNHSFSKSRTMSISEETSTDLLTDLSSVPYNAYKQVNNKNNRRFSELKPPLLQQTHGTNTERRNSTPQINLSFLLPYPFRSKKHQHKNTIKDDTNTSVNTFTNTYSLPYNDMMTMKSEQPFTSKSLNTPTNNLRTNLSISNDRLSSSFYEDSTSSMSSISSQFTLDVNQYEPRSAEKLTIELQTPLCIAEVYREQFFEYFHTNYYGGFEQEGPFVASLRCFNNKSILSDNTLYSMDTNTYCQARAIIRIPSRNYDVSVMVDGTNEDNILQILFNKAHLSAIHTCKAIGDPKANEKIYSFDKLNDERQNCKIGVIYQGVDQTNEYDIFSNDDVSDDMSNFLNLLADRVRLKGFNKYRGDLDIKDDLHGDSSYYTKYKNHEIMFNIAPMIPSTKANGQCIERKSLVGNAFVCIVFQEQDAEFTPDFISGKVTQIYITVQPCIIDENLYYKIGVWHRNDFTSIIDPPGGIYQCDQSFRDYFLTLLLNSINAAIESPSLRFRVAEQRQRIKHEELKKLLQNLSIGQTLDTITEIENNNSHGTQQFNSRSDSFINTTNDNTNSNSNSNSGRTSPVSSTKKRGLSKIFGVLTGRSGSISSPSPASIPSNPINSNTSLINSTSNEINTTQNRALPTASKESEKRRSSIKYRPAPPPPPLIQSQLINPPPHVIISTPPQVIISTQPPGPPVLSPYSIDSSNGNLSLQSNFLNPTTLEEIIRNRSNSSPLESINTTTKIPLTSVSKINVENDSTTNSSIDEDYDEELIEDDKIEHRQTLTDHPLILSSNINS
ncbi:unnamed protein product [Rotaria sordida]|uniref:Rap-GAP domain-containing protein n=1 Tax=Rotaria sordida TaxID=392033 RepID=A0A814JJD2_9BILA|nr:unnamed protein product [Rotaria sordida]